ncbi:MAG: lipid ethanolaminephosphotransferase, partial [Betaproteobacteria bacterium]|nr:lipid ethanolaminephosphotransferase [Betaproteobacteria bacterium]
SEITDLESPVSRTAPAGKKPLVMFLVIGETARAQNFQLGGYPRATNPELAQRGVDYFTNAYSCGTSTAVSLPCMFSGSGRKDFDAARAARGTNLLDALAKAGVAVQWRDNNSGCKGICARVPSVDYRETSSAAFCNAAGCYDEVMLEDLPQALAQLTTDTVIVFHQAGSHGPAYSQRYPKAFEVFKPVCYGNELSRCEPEEVVNAYDNSLLYTDHNVARQIDALKSAAASVDALLLYVSDHGESLGEKGLYLHGAPYMFAPDEQKRVPLLLWMSAEYRKRFGISPACVQGRKAEAVSHDNLYHTVLGAVGVKSARYDPQLDMLAACRVAGAAAGGDLVGMR